MRCRGAPSPRGGAGKAGLLVEIDSGRCRLLRFHAPESLKWIPADAAGYSVQLHLREQIEAIAKSRAWAKLQAMPAVQFAWQKARKELDKPNGPMAFLAQLYNQPENKELVELLADMGSNEIFIYGGQNFVGFANLGMQLASSLRFGPALVQLTGQAKGRRRTNLQAVALLNALSENKELIKVPDLVIGFKLSKTDRAEAQLKRLEKFLEDLVSQIPLLKGRLKRQNLGGNSFVTFNLDGSMVPWEEIPFKNFEDEPGEYAPLIKKLTELKLAIGLGVWNGYLVLSLGDSTKHLTNLGKGKGLAQQKEFKPLEQFADKRITSIGYSSKAIQAAVGASKKDIDDWVKVAEQYLPLLKLPEDKNAQVRKDLKELAKDLKPLITEPGASLSFSFFTGRGQESYSYDWGEYPGLDGSKPLTLLNHVGGSPLLAVMGRSKPSLQNYQMLVKWIKVAHGYIEEFGVPKLNPKEKEMYEKFAQAILPALRRLNDATEKMLYPALADGQFGFVLDAKLKSRQWLGMLPPTEKPLPILEPALVLGVSDGLLLEKAFADYRTTINHMITRIREVQPGVPQFQIPPPQTKKLKGGISYFYPLPKQWGIDGQIVPNAGLSKTVVVLAISHDHSDRLLAKTPLKAEGGPLADIDRPRAAAAYFNWPGLVDAATPWIELGVRAVEFQLKGAGEDGVERGMGDILKQVHTVLEVLKVFRSFSSSTFFEDGALVTHSETVIRDL